MSRTLILRPTAKINLTLRVGPRREDGFHEVRSLMQSIALHDTLTFSVRKGPFGLSCRMPGVPADQTNLVWKAATTLWTALGREGEPRDIHVKIEKSIPSQAGLGGGSSNAAATLVGLQTLWGSRLPRRELMRVAASLGSDVPFFLLGGTALATGRGEDLYPVEDIQKFGVVIIKPSFGVGTAEAYRWLDDDRAAGLPDGAAGREIEVGWPTGGVALQNDLTGPVARRHPAIQEVLDALVAEGAQGAQMSGSGSAVFALFSETVASRAARRLRRPEWWVTVTRTQGRRDAARHVGL
jgi:4-diphosphocytidyl-2-C-methyl-D-erythritol kinase